jgi:hypothetical protein
MPEETQVVVSKGCKGLAHSTAAEWQMDAMELNNEDTTRWYWK